MTDAVLSSPEQIARSLEQSFEQGKLDEVLSTVSLSSVDQGGKSILHWLIERKAKVDIIKAFIAVSRESCAKADSRGHIPLRFALEVKSELAVVQDLLEAYPSAAKELIPENESDKDRMHWYSKEKPKKLFALQFALVSKASEEIVLHLLKLNTDACKYTSSRFAGDLAFQLALMNDYPYAITRAILDSFQSIYSVESTFSSSVKALINEKMHGFVEALCQEEENRANYVTAYYLSRALLYWGLDVSHLTALVKKHSKICRTPNSSNQLLLHMGLGYRCSLEATKCIYDSFPQASREVDDAGMLPLHCLLAKREYTLGFKKSAAENEAFMQQFELLFQSNPDACSLKDKALRLPLHYALENKAPAQAVLQLVERLPDSVRDLFPSTGRSTPYALHLALNYTYPAEVVLRILSLYPDASKHADSPIGQYPLHYAARGHSAEVVAAVINAYPEACLKKAYEEKTPLFSALSFDEHDTAAVLQLIAGCPQACCEPNKFGMLPLDIAVTKRAVPEIVRALLLHGPADACHDKSADASNTDQLPLHRAVKSRAPAETIRLLIEANPAACQKRVLQRPVIPGSAASAETALPLHLALEPLSAKPRHALAPAYMSFDENQSALDPQEAVLTVQLLLESYPQAAAEVDGRRRLPLHYAAASAPIAVVRALLDAAPQVAQLADSDGRLPLHHAAESASLAVVQALLEVYPAGAAQADKDNRLPLHCSLGEKSNQKDGLVTEALAKAFPDGCAREAVFPSADGWAFSRKEAVSPLVFAITELRSGKTELLPVVLSLLAHLPPLLPHGKELSLVATIGTIAVEASKLFVIEAGMPAPLTPHVGVSAEKVVQRPTLYNDALTQILLAVMQRRLQEIDSFGDAVLHDIIDPAFEVAYPASKLEAVHQLLTRSRQLAKSMCESKDLSGRSAMHIADAAMRAILLKHLLFCGRFELAQGPVVHRSATSVVVQALDFQPAEDWKKLFHRYARVEEGKLSLAEFCLAGSTAHLFQYNSELSLAVNDKLSVRVPTDSDAPQHQRFAACFVKKGKSADGNVVVLVKAASQSHVGAEERTVNVHDLYPPELVEIAGLFASADTKHKGYLTQDEFLQCCRRRLGESRKVVLKFMRNQDQYQREIDSRSLDGDQEEGQLSSSLAGHVLELLTEPDPVLFKDAITELSVNGLSLAEYGYCLVMPEADRNLDSIRRFERPDTNSIRMYFKDIAQALQALHSAGIMHGDVKLLNAIRLHNHMQLIDLDAAASTTEGFAGAKFSSGVLPPEMFAELDATQRAAYERYWEPFTAIDAELWRKVKPVDIGNGKCIVVRSFAFDDDNAPVVPDASIYDLVPASSAIDAWSFGVMMFSMFARCPLLLVSDDDDLVPLMTTASTTRKNRIAAREQQPIQTAKDWTLKGIAQKLQVVEDTQARALLAQLLHPDPSERLSDMNEVLQHPFFSGAGGIDMLLLTQKLDGLSSKVDEGNVLARENQAALRVIQEGVQKLEHLSQEMLRRVDLTRTVLLKGIIEAHDVVVPSCFVIVNQLLLSPADALALEQQKSGDVLQERMDKASGWLTKIAGFLSVATDPKALLDAANDRLTEMLQGESLYLYLVDEVTMQPVIPSKDSEFFDLYPIEITTQSDRAKQLVPLMKLSLTAISLMNSASGLARCLGYPTPYIPDSVQDSLRGAVQQMDEPTSIAQFDKLQSIALSSMTAAPTDSADAAGSDSNAGSKGDPQTVRGLALRQLKALLETKDPGCSTFCGLQRVISPQGDGKVIWTNEEGMQQLEQGTVHPMVVDTSMQTDDLPSEPQPDQAPFKGLSSAHAQARAAPAEQPAVGEDLGQQAESASDEDDYDIGTAGAGLAPSGENKKHKGQEHQLLQMETVDRLSMYVTTAQQADHRERLASAVADSPAAVRHFERAAYSIDVCVNVLYEAAQIFFGPGKHNIARPRRFPSLNLRGKLNLRKELQGGMRLGGSGASAAVSKMVSGALVVQTLKKCQSLHTGQSLYYMLLLGEWDEVLKLESSLVSSSLAVKAGENNNNNRV